MKTTKSWSKMLLSGMFALVATFGLVLSGCEWLWSTEDNPSEKPTLLEEGVYIGIISFDEDTHDISSGPVLLDHAGKAALKSRIDSNFKRAGTAGTLLYYAVHKALSSIKELESKLPANARSFNIITFTDGIDLGSTGPALWREEPLDGQNFEGADGSEYLGWLNYQLETAKVKDQAVAASAYGVAGADVTDSAVFADNLRKLTTLSGKFNTAINYDQLSDEFGELAGSLNVTTTTTSFNLLVTPTSNGTQYKMTFDNIKDSNDSQVYFTGTYNYNGGTYTLSDIEYHGITGSVTDITGTENGRKVMFSFGNLSLSSGSPINPEVVQQWLLGPSDSKWQRNSEYDTANTSKSSTEKSSAIIYLILDSSKSLSENEVDSIKTAAKNFIDVLYSKYYPNEAPKLTAPVNLQASALSPDSIKIIWDPVSGAKSYYVYRSDSASGTYDLIGSSAIASYTDGGLQSDKTYYYKAATVNSANEPGEQSSSASATTKPAQTGGTGEIRIYNDSKLYNIIRVWLYDVSADENIDETDFSNTPIGYDNYVYWKDIPSGKKYQVRVKDDYGDDYTSSAFILSNGQILEVSYDGFGLSLIYDPQSSSQSLGRSLNSVPKILKTLYFQGK